MIVRGRVWKFGDNIDTDLLYPNVALKLPPQEGARYVFHANRPEWVDQVQPGDLVLGGRNFGCGSSRPVPRLFRVLGVKAVVAEEFASLFFRNSMNYAFPSLSCQGVLEAFEEGQTAEVDFSSGLVRNVDTGTQLQGDRLPELLLNLLMTGGIMPMLRREGYFPQEAS